MDCTPLGEADIELSAKYLLFIYIMYVCMYILFVTRSEIKVCYYIEFHKISR